MRKFIVPVILAFGILLVSCHSVPISNSGAIQSLLPPPDIGSIKPPPPPSIAETDNAFAWMVKAGNALKITVPDASGHEIAWNPLLSGDTTRDQGIVKNALEANRETFSLLAKAMGSSVYRFPEDAVRPHPSSPLPLASINKLTQLLCLKSQCEHVGGDYEAAFQTAEQCRKLNERMGSDGPFLVLYWMASIRYQQLAVEQLEALVNDVSTPDSVLVKLKDLDLATHQDIMASSLRRGWYYEHIQFREQAKETACFIILLQAHNFDAASLLEAKPSESELLNALEKAKKKKNIDLDFMVRLHAEYCLSAFEQTGLPYIKFSPRMADYPEYPEDIEKLTAAPDGTSKISKLTVVSLAPAHEKMYEKWCQLQARMAFIKLQAACRLYQKKHGQLPSTLAALVPGYFPAILLDPFDGHPIRYLPEKKILYCVGRDGVDNGSKLPPADYANYKFIPKGCDMVKTIEWNPWRPPAPKQKPVAENEPPVHKPVAGDPPDSGKKKNAEALD